MKNTIVKDTIVLCIITLIAGLALGAVHAITLEPIAKAQAAAANATYAEVYPEASDFSTNDDLKAKIEAANAEIDSWGLGNNAGKLSINDAMIAKDASGNEVGYMINATSGQGYGGNVKVSVGISNDGAITGIGYLTLNETPGLGMKAKEPAFRDQFVGKSAAGTIEMIKSGSASESQFMAISGATFTSSATNYAVNAAVKFVNDYIK